MQAASRKFSLLAGTAALTCAFALGGLARPASADDDGGGAAKPHSYPYVKGSLSIELHHDELFNADDPAAEGSDTNTTTELEIGAYFSPHFSVHGHFTFEPVEDLGPSEDRFFHDHGLYAEQLYAKLTLDPFEVTAGKLHVNFGKAWDDTPGVYGTDLNGDYEIAERIGFGFSVSREHTPLGKVTLSGSTFFADTSFLSDSAFTSRGPVHRSDGGLSNTGSLGSFALALEGEDIPGFAGLTYNLGFIHQAGGVDDIDDQSGVVFGLKRVHKYNGVEFEWIGETAWFDYGGDLYDTDDPVTFVDHLWYWTLGAQATFNEQYRISAAYTARNAELYDNTDIDDYQATVSAGMKVWREWWLDAGYKVLEQQDQDVHVVGLMLSKTMEFERSRGELEPMK